MTENIAAEPDTIPAGTAFAIFEGRVLGQHEAQTAYQNLNDDEKWSFEGYVEEFQFHAAQVGIAAQAELVETLNASTYQFPENKQDFTFGDWANLVALLPETKYEKLHYAHLFGFQNPKALLGFVRESYFAAQEAGE
jgi:hypothetical protein